MADMSKLRLSLDLTSDLAPPSETTTLKSETSTLNDQNMSVASSRSSICSFTTDNSNITSPLSTKTAKKVRFEESVSWSYFDEPSSDTTRPEPERRGGSFLGRSWQRFKQRNSSGDLDITPPAIQLRQLKRQTSSTDILSTSPKPAAGKSSLLASSAATKRPSLVYSERHPLREGSGRRFNGAETYVSWRASSATAKGDWGDLLKNPRQSALYA